MEERRQLKTGIFLITALLAFTFSLFKWNNQVWIAGWIAPLFLLRFMRRTKWRPAFFLGLLVLAISYNIGYYPAFASFEMEILSWVSIVNFLTSVVTALLFLVPFILDKALHKRLLDLASTLVFPASFVAVEFLFSLFQGTIFCLGQSQYTLRPIVMITSLFGVFSISFLITWSASLINKLWEADWDIKQLGRPGIVFLAITASLLIYGAVSVYSPRAADSTVMVAGITIDSDFNERLFNSDHDFFELGDEDPEVYSKDLRSPQSHIDEMRNKTLEAVSAGAKIIVWQEYALMMESAVADTLLDEMRILADKENVYLVVSYARILSAEEKKDKFLRNLAVLLTPEGEIGWEYDKAFPIIGEYFMIDAGEKNIPYVDTPYGRIGQVICFDMHFPHYLRQAGKNKIDIVLSSSVDETAFTPLHTFNNGMRAVENGFTMVRIVGDGHSAVIDPYYRHWAGQTTMEHGTDNFYYTVPVISKNTVYSSIGYLFPYAVALLLIGLVVLAIVKKKAGID